MSKVLQLLKTLRPDYPFEKSTNFLEDGFLDSLTLITLITEFEHICGIEIDIAYIDEDDLISEESLLRMVERFGGDISLLQ